MKSTIKAPLIFLLLCCCCYSCSGESEEEQARQHPTIEKPAVTVENIPSPQKGCRACHTMNLDPAHDMECTTCHKGNSDAEDKESGHEQLIKHPSHPDHMLQICGQCHEQQVKNSAHSLHFTVQNKVNMVRKAFGAENTLQSLTEIPVVDSPETLLGLADDLLRRRCLRCHPYFSGDEYPATARGTGCASCHLSFYEGKLVSHSFMKTPSDAQCLQCHYGNWVGYDYYGRYEHDMNDEYRTPYTTKKKHFRPFGIEFHQLSPDIHQQKGLLCVDCHSGNELMGTGTGNSKIHCADCHDGERISKNIPLANIHYSDAEKSYILVSARDGERHIIPLLESIVHSQYKDIANCQVCHAQWSFNDTGTHLMRNDLDEHEDFARLSVQGSYEVEKIINNNLDFDKEEIDNSMSDKISGEQKPGLWYKGYLTRRWEQVTIARDENGYLQVVRPLLDLHLSWVDEEEAVRFDSVPATVPANGFVPYVPHTTGKAGLFYMDRIRKVLKSEKESAH